MENATLHSPYRGLARLKLFWALSRTPHALLDMAAPAFGALLWLGGFPSLLIIAVGVITVFAGYTAVYALNDVIDYRVDREKVKIAGGLHESDGYLDAMLVRHPMAQGLLSFREGLMWALGWSGVALAGAYWLNPVCVLIFLAGCILEVIYCLMLRVSPIRTLISGGVKTSGSLAAVFAVDPDPSFGYLAILFFWLFFWEIGGQNIPADWADIQEDRRLGAQTIPVRLGTQTAAVMVLISLILTLACNMLLAAAARGAAAPLYLILSAAIGMYLLLPPSVSLYGTRDRSAAMALFNRASYYPLTMLGVAVLTLLL